MFRKLKLSRALSLTICLILTLGIVFSIFAKADASQLGHRSLQLSNATASQTSVYNFSFNLVTSASLGSITFDFCSNDAIIGDTCTAPSGFSDSAATLTTQTGQTGFTISNASTANEIILTRTPSASAAGAVNYVFSNITNPSSSGAYFVRLLTYSTSNASGGYTDYGGIAFSISSEINISATVPPYLIFCSGLSISGDNCANASGDFIDLGALSSARPSTGTSQMLASSNSETGYNITVYGTTMESGNNVINAISSPDVSRPGTSQFGLNLRANISPAGGLNPSGPGSGTPAAAYNQSNFFTFNSGDVVASVSGPDLSRLYTEDYLVNVPANQAPGVYDTSLTYICLATF